MFTGLIEELGTVARLVSAPGGHELAIRTPLAQGLAAGDSLAVNGVCLTVAGCEDGAIVTKVGPETARITNLGRLQAGTVVNLERPVRADSRMGGHFVLGHVDGTGRIKELSSDGEFYWLRVAYPPALRALIIVKGSVAVDGISLTVARLSSDDFDVQIVPYTWQHTNLHARATGDDVNLECDVLGKYVLRALDARKGEV
ncbi:MAG: riboflavin synthase [Acidobacteria bacterium]|nr:riboflavin synthase [Acidobacteriota bacterium]